MHGSYSGRCGRCGRCVVYTDRTTAPSLALRDRSIARIRRSRVTYTLMQSRDDSWRNFVSRPSMFTQPERVFTRMRPMKYYIAERLSLLLTCIQLQASPTTFACMILYILIQYRSVTHTDRHTMTTYIAYYIIITETTSVRPRPLFLESLMYGH